MILLAVQEDPVESKAIVEHLHIFMGTGIYGLTAIIDLLTYSSGDQLLVSRSLGFHATEDIGEKSTTGPGEEEFERACERSS